jgi:hypothetical protein
MLFAAWRPLFALVSWQSVLLVFSFVRAILVSELARLSMRVVSLLSWPSRNSILEGDLVAPCVNKNNRRVRFVDKGMTWSNLMSEKGLCLLRVMSVMFVELRGGFAVQSIWCKVDY